MAAMRGPSSKVHCPTTSSPRPRRSRPRLTLKTFESCSVWSATLVATLRLILGAYGSDSSSECAGSGPSGCSETEVPSSTDSNAASVSVDPDTQLTHP